MKRYLLPIIFAFATLFPLSAVDITGIIKDKNTKEAIGYANIALKDKATQQLKSGTTTNDDGTFTLQAPRGEYIIEFSFIGYKTLNKNISITSSSPMQLGSVLLEEDAQLLNEVEVVGQGMQMRMEIDKKVFSVDQNLAAAGASVSEVLQNIPSVNVDGDGNVSLRNNSSVEIWINGKPAGLTEENRGQILEQMPSGSIESVEIITNPSAKHSPEGTAGVINLVMKKTSQKNYYGSVSAGITWPTACKIPGGNIGASFNYNSPKVDFYTNLGVRYNSFVSGGETMRYSLLNQDTTSLLQSNTKNIGQGYGIFARAGVDVRITDRNTITIGGFGMFNQGKSTSDIDYTQTNYTIPNTRIYMRDNKGTNQFPLYNATLGYKYDFEKKGSYLSADFTVGNHGHSRSTDYLQSDILGLDSVVVTSNETQNSSNKNLRFEGNLDFSYKFTDKRRLEAGWESNVSRRLNEASAYDNLLSNEREELYNKFLYKEQIHSLYATYGDMFGNFSMQLGLRGEYMKVNTVTETKSETIENERNYWQLFPSAFFAYRFPKNHELQINYTRRVNRPRGRQINPYKNFSDSTSITFGNPYLDPQFSSSVELNYLKTWDFHSISASAYYRYTDNVIQSISYRHQNVMENTFINISRHQSAGVELVARNQLWKRLTLTSSINLYYEKLDSAHYTSPYGETLLVKAQEDFSWSARLSANVLITKTTTAQISANYNAPHIIAQGKQTGNYSLDFSLRQTFLKGKLSLSVTARDILDSRKRHNEIQGVNFIQTSSRYWSGRTIGLTIAYNFGNMKNKKNDNSQSRDMQNSSDFFMEE